MRIVINSEQCKMIQNDCVPLRFAPRGRIRRLRVALGVELLLDRRFRFSLSRIESSEPLSAQLNSWN